MIGATGLFSVYGRWRAARLARQDVAGAQRRELRRLLARAAATRFGREHDFAHIRDPRDFAGRVRLRRYEDFWRDYWQPAFPRLVDNCWPGLIPFFALSSGTTTGGTKYIPLSFEMLRSNRRAGLDLIVHHLRSRPCSSLFGGRSLLLGGSAMLAEEAPRVRSGDLSGIVLATMPRWLRRLALPPPDIARLSDWNEKIARLVALAPAADIRNIAGTPSWLLLFFDRLAAACPERDGRLADFFPNLELLVHGGVNFAPYRARFTEWLAGSHAELREVYAASEGFIAAADRGDGEGLRVVADHGIFYEFVPVAEIDAAAPTRHWLGTIEPGVDYAIVLTTCAGLWAYLVGDTVRFLEREPPRLLVTGRLSYSMSAFGEHLIDEEIEAAIAAAAQAIGAGIRDFALGAVFPTRPGELGFHVFVAEFERPVAEPERRAFAAELDRDLQRRNLDYAAHRAGLDPPHVAVMPPGGFAEWMRQRGKLGGQHKVPRIINDADLFGDLRAFAEAAARAR